MNARRKAAAISATGALVVATIAISSFYGGWRTKVGREAVREQVIDDHLKMAEGGFERLAAVESAGIEGAAKINGLSARVDNLDDNVRTLIETQSRTNEKLDRLTQTLMDYLAAQARKGAPSR